MEFKCPLCPKVFGSMLEFRLHWSHNHYGPVPTPLSQSVPVGDVTPWVAPVEEPEVEEEAPYSLAASGEGLGELYPVLKDAFGNVIDGFHRLGENPNWHSEVRPQIDTPVKLQLAMLAANFNRRNMAPEEVTQRITFLIKAGLKVEEIAKQTGLTERTVRKYMPQEFKNQTFVEMGKKSHIQSQDTAHAEDVHFTNVNPAPDTVTTPTASKTVGFEPTPEPTPKPESSQLEQEEELVPPGTPVCPCCGCALDPNEYRQIKRAVALKFGKQIQTLLFPGKQIQTLLFPEEN